MSSRQRHRGQHPQDARLFSEKYRPALRAATTDLSFLLTRGYAVQGALELVGNHYQLHQRQRKAVRGAACSDQSLAWRREHCVSQSNLPGQVLVVDAYNVLITAESLLSGGIVIRGRDGNLRDLAGVHGAWRKVEETVPALETLGQVMVSCGVREVQWLLDRPVSNSGRLRVLMQDLARERGWPWTVVTIDRVDRTITESEGIVVTSDGWILDRVRSWTSLLPALLSETGMEERFLDLSHP